MRRVRLIENLIQDLRYGLRTLRKSPGFTAVAVLSLALGIGSNTAIFSLVDPILLRLLPVKDPEQLVVLNIVDQRGKESPWFSYPIYEQLRARTQVFSGVFAANSSSSIDMVGPEPGNQTEKTSLLLVSGEYFQVLGVNAGAGRTLTTADNQAPGAHPVAVLSHRFWERRFAGDVSVIGKVITLKNQPLTIIGVTTPEFFGAEWGEAPDIWAPLMMAPTLDWHPSDLSNVDIAIMARLRPGARREQAQAALDIFLGQIKSEPNDLGKQAGMSKIVVTPGSQGIMHNRAWLSQPLRILMAVVGLALLIACANVANLLLARAARRAPEVAVRLTIGAGRFRLIRQFLTENAMLAAAGAVLGLLFAWWGSRIIAALVSEFFDASTGTILANGIDAISNARVLGFTIAVTLLTTLLFGLAPALIAARQDLNIALKTPAPPRSRLSLTRFLVIAQVALSFLLLTGAGLFVQTLHNLRARVGFAAERIIHFGVNLSASGYKPEQYSDLNRRIIERLNSAPGVVAATMEGGWDPGRKSWACCIAVEGYSHGPDEDRYVQTKFVRTGYLQTLGLPLLLGRDFTPQEISSDPEKFAKVAIINETMARQYYGSENPLGKRFGWGDPQPGTADRPGFRFDRGDPTRFEIIGVAKDAVYSNLRDKPRPLVYFPGQNGNYLVARTTGPAAPLVATIRHEIQAVDKNLEVGDIYTASQQLDQELFLERLLAKLSSFFALIALLLACIGLYGLMSYDVACRTHEIGIRMALGAQRRDVVGLVLRETMLLVIIGVVIGLSAALGATRLVASLLYGLTPNDPLTIGLASMLLLAVAALAGYLPARRAARVDPMVALRHE